MNYIYTFTIEGVGMKPDRTVDFFEFSIDSDAAIKAVSLLVQSMYTRAPLPISPGIENLAGWRIRNFYTRPHDGEPYPYPDAADLQWDLLSEAANKGGLDFTDAATRERFGIKDS